MGNREKTRSGAIAAGRDRVTVESMETTGGNGMAKLLAGLGITAVRTQDAATHAVQEELTRTGVQADVTGVRWGAVTIEGGQAEIAALAWHRDRLVAAAAEASDGEVTRVILRVRGPR